MSNAIQDLKEIARRIRVETVKELHKARSGHPGSSLSIVEVLTALYFGGILKHDPVNPDWEERDYFILSNGHAAPGLYACLALAGYFSPDLLSTLRQLGSPLQGHAKRGSPPGVEVSSGSLGQGLSVGCGLALALRREKRPNRVFVLMSDGEQQEGSTWEAVMFAAKERFPNLVAIVDQNGNQINGPTHVIMPVMDELLPKYQAFSWRGVQIEGNDVGQVIEALHEADRVDGPFVIISKSTTGKGVSFMEGDYHWHHGVITDELYAKAMADLGETIPPASAEAGVH
jgi:transketolase